MNDLLEERLGFFRALIESANVETVGCELRKQVLIAAASARLVPALRLLVFAARFLFQALYRFFRLLHILLKCKKLIDPL